MKLREIVENIKSIQVKGNIDIDITSIETDSRKVCNGCLFIAVVGTITDGHKFILSAIEKGASAIVCQDIPDNVKVNDDFPIITTEDTSSIVGHLATKFYEEPTQKLKLVGITGTNGKTTIATLLYNMFKTFGHKCGLISTVCNYIEDEKVPSTHTTPDPIELNKLLFKMQKSGCEYVFMECSSHAIAQHRIAGLHFTGGIFTNLTRDHLDYHKTFDNYRDAKKIFFDTLPKTSFAITNIDDKNGMYMLQNSNARQKTYSIRSMADYKAKIIECHFEGMYIDFNGKEVGVQLTGKFNVSNLLAVYATACELGKKPEDILLVMSTLSSVDGRMQPIRSEDGITGIVDYAHTPDAIASTLSAIHEVLNGGGKIITVCGCGGNRDKGKRPLMAQEAVKQSDKVILTSDNPRFENPIDIIKDMEEGLTPTQKKKTLSIENRKEAIKTACMLAQKGDVILVAGKGHEDYQEVNGVKCHFDDREILQEMFNNK